MTKESAFPSVSEAVVITEKLTAEHLQELFVSKQRIAIVVQNFVNVDEAEQIANSVLQDSELVAYLAEPAFAKVGLPWYEATTDALRKFYLDGADGLIQHARGLCSPFPMPVERLHLALDRLWPVGATIQRIAGRAMYYGLPRVLNAGGPIEPHQDVLTWDSPGATGIENYVTQAAANVYLQMSDAGGELLLWDRSYERDEFELNRNPKSPYGLDRDKIGPPAAVLRPDTGALVLFDANRVHAVNAAKGSPRITFSCFVGFFGQQQPLTLWS